MPNNPRRLALTIKGGVSLGAYEAGAIAEILKIIAYNNQNGGTPWHIDAIAGASAGSITAALLAWILAGQGPDTLLHDAWVTDISLERLAGGAASPNTILNSNAVATLADTYLPQLPSPLTPHPAFNGQSVSLALTVSGLALDPEVLTTLNNSQFTWHEYSVVGRFKMLVSAAGAPDYWASPLAAFNYAGLQPGAVAGFDAYRALKQTAIASGAFPLAFSPRGLARFENNATWQKRWFSDGGVYDNDPVGEMINLAHDIDWSVNAYDDRDRRFLIIEPEPLPKGKSFPPAGVAPVELLDIGPADLLREIVPGLLEETQESGVRGIAAINRQIDERQNVLSDLCSALNASTVDFGTLQRLTASITDQLARRRNIDQATLQVFRDSYIDDLAALDPDLAMRAMRLDDPASGRSNVKAAFVEFGLLMDFAANLADKVRFRPIVVAPEKKLEGDPAFGFSGFFLRQIREHDFQQGRSDAYKAFKAINDPAFSLYTSGAPTDPTPVTPLPPPLQQVYDTNKQRFDDRIAVVVDTLVAEVTAGDFWFDIPILGSGIRAAASFIVDKIVESFLGV